MCVLYMYGYKRTNSNDLASWHSKVVGFRESTFVSRSMKNVVIRFVLFQTNSRIDNDDSFRAFFRFGDWSLCARECIGKIEDKKQERQ